VRAGRRPSARTFDFAVSAVCLARSQSTERIGRPSDAESCFHAEWWPGACSLMNTPVIFGPFWLRANPGSNGRPGSDVSSGGGLGPPSVFRKVAARAPSLQGELPGTRMPARWLPWDLH
jgi:hypothetical protein